MADAQNRFFGDYPPPCEVYNCENQDLCKTGLACSSYQDHLDIKSHPRPPTEPSEKMFNLIFGDE